MDICLGRLDTYVTVFDMAQHEVECQSGFFLHVYYSKGSQECEADQGYTRHERWICGNMHFAERQCKSLEKFLAQQC